LRADIAAAMADPRHHRHFSRCWLGPPGLKRQRPSLQAGAIVGTFNINRATPDTIAAAAGSRAVLAALGRAPQLERRAATLDLCRLRDAACCHRVMAAAIREAVL
jgi:hypothetical protein